MMNLKRICIGVFMLAWGTLGSADTVFAQLSWTRQTTSVMRQLKDIRFSDAQHGIAVGDTGTILRTTDGSTWTMATSSTENNLWTIGLLPGSNGMTWIAGGDDGTILRSTDGGMGWQKISSGMAPGSFIFSVTAIDPTTVFVAGGDFAVFSGVVLKSTDAGLTWTSKPIPGTTFIDKVSFATPMIGYAAGNDVTSGTPKGKILKTTDGGATWTNVKTTDNILSSIKAVSADVAIAVGRAGGIDRTTDGGVTWSTSTPVQNDLFALDFADAMNGIIVGYLVSMTTSDGGATWTTMSIDDYLSGVQYVPGASAIYAVGSEGTIIKGMVAAGVSAPRAMGYGAALTIDPSTRMARLHGIEGHEREGLVCTIHDLLGRRVARVDVSSTGAFLLPEMAPGTHLYTVSNAAGSTLLSGRLVVR
jgi:photosystem II stability/assembly factor-like uncharacterized protein